MSKEQTPEGEIAGSGASKADVGKAPIFQGVVSYFPRALQAVALVSDYGAKKYDWEGWRNVKDGLTRYTNSAARHLVEACIEPYDTDPDKGSDLPHLAHLAWNALAVLELALERGDIEMRPHRPLRAPETEAPKPHKIVGINSRADSVGLAIRALSWQRATPGDDRYWIYSARDDTYIVRKFHGGYGSEVLTVTTLPELAHDVCLKDRAAG